MVGELHYKVKTEFYNGNGGIVLDFFGNVSHPVKVKWRDYHFNEKNYIITSHVDTIRSFYCYFNNRSSPANCSKLVDILKHMLRVMYTKPGGCFTNIIKGLLFCIKKMRISLQK